MLLTIPRSTHHQLLISQLEWKADVEVYFLDAETPQNTRHALVVGVAHNPKDYIGLMNDHLLDMLISVTEWEQPYTIYNIHRTHYRYVELIQQESANISMQKRLEQMNADIKQGLLVVAHLIGIRNKPLGEHSIRVATLSKIFARLYKLNYEEETAIYQAGLLHDIGLLKMPDAAFNVDLKHMDPKLFTQWNLHADLGAQILQGFPWLQKAAELVRSHHERHDGRGTPFGLAGHQIPPGAMILSIVSDYDDWQRGHFDGIHRTPREAIVEMMPARGTRYEPNIFDFFINNVIPAVARTQVYEEEMLSSKLESDMILSRDIFSYDGVLLLASGRRLTNIDISMIRRFEERTRRQLSIWIKNQ